MTRPDSFGRDYLLREFDKLSAELSSPLTVLAIGGAAMIFYGLKAATKDIDVVLLEPQQVDILVTALRSLSYSAPDSDMITAPYKEMAAQQIMENEDGFRWDIFLRTIGNALTVSDSMSARATSLYSTGNLSVHIASKQDLFSSSPSRREKPISMT